MRRAEALREYAGASLWVLPFVAANVALLVGVTVASIEVPPDGLLGRLAFQGTADDARTLLMTIAGTVVTVLALVLGLSVVALQLSSTQFSPRLLRNFLRDKPNQLALSVFMATFSYSAAGLFTVGVASGERIQRFPRLAVSGAIALLFASLAMVVVFADHLSHALQIDAIMRRVERETLAVIRAGAPGVDDDPPTVPPWAVPLRARCSGYVQTAHPETLLPVAARHGAVVALRRRVGEHVVAGSTIGWVWRPAPDAPAPDRGVFERAIGDAVGIGFERTRQQDVAIGIRQLVDIACKALSPAVNDPYTAVQAIDHLAVIFSELARSPLGPRVARDARGQVAVVVPSRRFGEYLATMCGLVRRYGSREPTVAVALLRLLATCAEAVGSDHRRLADIDDQARLVVEDADREIVQPADRASVRAEARRMPRPVAPPQPDGVPGMTVASASTDGTTS